MIKVCGIKLMAIMALAMMILSSIGASSPIYADGYVASTKSSDEIIIAELVLRPVPNPRYDMFVPNPLPNPRYSAAGLLSQGAISPNQGNRKKWRVFIDAGHGGKDPGAIGYSGLKEKNVNLQAAMELARQFNRTGKVTAILSRDRDVFHELRRRIALAKEAKADVFISLHADAIPNKKIRGVGVFTLSDRASDEEAALLAVRENQSDLFGDPEIKTADPIAREVLLDIFQRDTLNQSSVLAQTVLGHFKGLPTPNRGHRFAGFAVLKSPDIPSILVEMGFLTNKRDERYLRDAGYRRDLMARIRRAVLDYLEKAEIRPTTQ